MKKLIQYRDFEKKYSINLIILLIFFNMIFPIFSTSVKISNKSFSFNLRSLTKDQKSTIYGKGYFILSREIDKNNNYHLNTLNKVIFEVTNTDIFFFRNQIKEKDTITFEELKNNFFLGLKLGDIDLICGDYLFLCTFGQFKKEYKDKMKKYNLNLNSKIEKKIAELLDNPQNIETNCLIITTGAFSDINSLPFFCFEVN